MTTTIKVYFKWDEYRPDNRQYKQQSMLVWPLLDGDEVIKVEMDLPVNLLANAEEYLEAEIEGNKPPKPIFSIAAVKYLVDEWEKVFSDVSPDDFTPHLSNADADWSADLPQSDPSGITEPEDNWDDVTTTEEPIPWNEKDEDWGSEPNFDN